VEPEVQEVIEVPPPKGDELLAELRESAPVTAPFPERIELKLTLDQASFLYERLHAVVVDPPKLKLAAIMKETFTVPPSLLILLDDRLEEMRSTTPAVQGERGNVRFLKQSVTLEVRPHEKKYLLRILANKKRDGWRRDKATHERFSPLEVAEIAEEEGGRASFFGPSHPENPTANLPQAVMQKALGELPKLLRMSAQDMDALLAALYAAEGNVSEAARQLGQPQRKTARQIERIQEHLKRRGLVS
jgi:DNA-directed RNA polymerase specialized sigma24 family protein